MWRVILRGALWTIAALVAVALMGAGLLFWYVSSPAFHERVIAEIERQTGRDLTVSGRMHVAFWPVVGVSAEQVTLANVEGGVSPFLVAAEEVDVGVDVPAALRRQLVIRRIRLERPTFTLEVDEQGRGNWILARAAASPPAPPTPSPEPAPDAEAPEPAAQGNMRVEAFRVIDGRISYLDRRTGLQHVLSAVDLRTHLDGLDEPAAIDAAFSYRDEPITLTATMDSPRAMSAGRRSPLRFAFDSRFLTASFDGETAAGSGAVNGRIEAAGPSIRELTRWLGTPLGEGPGLGRFNIAGMLTVAPRSYAFEDASIEFDAVLARGDFELVTGRERPYLNGRLQVMRLDMNRYLRPAPPAPSAGVAEAASEPAAPVAEAAALDVTAESWGETPIRLDFLRSVDAQLELTTGPLTIFRTTVDRSVLTATVYDGFFAATIHELELYQGTGSGRVEVDGRAPGVRFTQDLALDGVAVQPFLTDVLGVSQIEGSGQVRLALTVQGETQSALVSSASGRMAVVLNQGAIRGVDIGGLSETIGAAMRNELVRADARTEFLGMSGSFAVAGGRVASDDLEFILPRMRVTGAGVIDLPQRRLDFRYAARGRILTTPFTMRGPFGAFEYNSDLRGRRRAEIEGLVRAVKTAAPG
jgi:AsmA protein